jgi:hypothetical protein
MYAPFLLYCYNCLIIVHHALVRYQLSPPQDYFNHWLNLGARADLKMPKIFHVNWFQKDDHGIGPAVSCLTHSGRFIWPGFGENIRVLEWIFNRCSETVGAVSTPIGLLPSPVRGVSPGLSAPPLYIYIYIYVCVYI